MHLRQIASGWLAAALLAFLCLNAVVAAQAPASVDGCDSELYLDRTAPTADRSLNWDFSFAADPERCIVVRAGQSVVWQGNFGDHPLQADEGDRPNPIAGHANGVVIFDRPGTFGFRCNFHLAMRGAIRVLPAAPAVPWSGAAPKATLLALLLAMTVLATRPAFARAQKGAVPCERARHLAQRCLEPAVLLIITLCLARALGPGRYGAPDSATYLSAAEHLTHGDGYVTSSLNEHGRFEPLTYFAPLFSLLIAGDAMLRGVSAREAIGDIMLGSFLLYALGCLFLLRALLPNTLRRWAFVFTLGLLCAPGSVTCLRGALSDLLGAALALLACAHFLAHAEKHRGSNALCSGALFALSIWARWSNLYFVASACIGLLCATRAEPFRRRLRSALELGLSMLVFVGPLWLRNAIATGSTMGARPFAASSPLLHIQRALLGIAQPFLRAHEALADTPLLAKLYVTIAIVCGAFVLALWLTRRDARSDRGLLLALGYGALLVLSSSSTQFDPLDHARFWLALSPLLLGLSVRAFSSAEDYPPRRLVAVLSLSLLAAVSGRSALAVAQESARLPARSGLFAPHFASSEAVRTALALFDDGRCTLSAPHAFWLYPQIGTRPISWLTEANDKTLSRPQPSCVLLLREQVAYNTDSVRFRESLQERSSSLRARLLRRDALAELWWTAAISRAPLAEARIGPSAPESAHAHR